MNTDIYKTKLEEEKALVEANLGEIGKKDKTGDWEAVPETEMASQEVPDEADMAERSEDYEERTSKVESLESHLANINRALAKIDEGSYGVCDICGKEIGEDRLGANISALTCKDCMNKV